jgi:hypothetical protein
MKLTGFHFCASYCMVADIQKWHFGAIHFGLVSRILQWYYMCNGINTTSVLYTTPTVGGQESCLPLEYFH